MYNIPKFVMTYLCSLWYTDTHYSLYLVYKGGGQTSYAYSLLMRANKLETAIQGSLFVWPHQTLFFCMFRTAHWQLNYGMRANGQLQSEIALYNVHLHVHAHGLRMHMAVHWAPTALQGTRPSSIRNGLMRALSIREVHVHVHVHVHACYTRVSHMH